MQKDVAGQTIGFEMISSADGDETTNVGLQRSAICRMFFDAVQFKSTMQNGNQVKPNTVASAWLRSVSPMM